MGLLQKLVAPSARFLGLRATAAMVSSSLLLWKAPCPPNCKLHSRRLQCKFAKVPSTRHEEVSQMSKQI